MGATRLFRGTAVKVLAVMLCALTAGCSSQGPLGSKASAPIRFEALTKSDIGNPAIAGSLSQADGQLTVTAGGTDIWGRADQFTFVHLQKTGDFDVAVQGVSLTLPHLYSRGGLMARESLAPGSRHVSLAVFPDNQARHNNTSAYELQYRSATDGSSAAIYPPPEAAPPPFPVNFPNTWLRLKRVGNQFTTFASTDGKHWKLYSAYSLDLPSTVFLGLAVTSHTAKASITAVFKNLGDVRDAELVQ